MELSNGISLLPEHNWPSLSHLVCL